MVAKGSSCWIVTAFVVTVMIGIIAYITQFKLALYATASSMSIALFFIWFFRDPERNIQYCDQSIVAPADGRVIDIRGTKVCTFMNIHNVHVNRVPLSGTVKNIEYSKGGYLPAFCKDSDRNERAEITLDTKYGDIVVTQIAGALVRRIVSYVNVGDKIEQGDKIGMIRFGSRVDVTIPESFKITCKKGDKVIAGETILATCMNELN
ncbi:phosphatidylserine decarboxylase [Methanosalsum natronophilum]|uniref:phosphatidylserine decarboxylase n=1 Tax=Methanosalsum natronophilum TaxID=768733 RepID=UPI00216A67B9|nr:phosphatidylserine decarboxylase [Methanosalsum natronophilum]MCS3923716.1 phosphatidylserine decarboxylase [Methanosalsum natronophilum]